MIDQGFSNRSSLRRFLGLVVTLGVCLALFAPSARAESKPNVAVLNLEGTHIDTRLLDNLTAVLRNEAQQATRYGVVQQAPTNLSEILVVLGCSFDSHQCLAEAARSLQVRFIIYGQVEHRSSGYQVRIDIFDAATGQVIQSFVRTLEARPDPLITFRHEVGAFFESHQEQPLTRLEIASNIKGASIRLEDTVVGVTPLERIGLPPGRYKVEVTAPGYDTWRTVIELREGSDMQTWANLLPPLASPPPPAEVDRLDEGREPLASASATRLVNPAPSPWAPSMGEGTERRSWGAWSAVGAGVLTLGGSAAMVVLMRNVEQEIQDQSGRDALTSRQYQELLERGQVYELSHRVLLGVGVVSTTAGLLWLALDDDGASSSIARSTPARPLTAARRWHLEAGPNAVGVRVAF